MKLFSLSLFSVLISYATFSSAQDLVQQRETYQKINQLLSLSQSEATQKIARGLYTQITDYPLAPYAEYQLLAAQSSPLNLQQLQDYQQHNPTLPFNQRLQQQWLQQRQQQQDWQSIVQQQSLFSDDPSNQCVILQAKITLNAPPVAIQQADNAIGTEKTSPFLTAVLPDIEKLWLTGKSLPKTCDPVFAQWRERGGINDNLIQQRALLAFQQKNAGLLTALQHYQQSEATQHLIDKLTGYLANPALLANTNNALDPNNAIDREILLATFPAYIKTLHDAQLSDQNDPFSTFAHWAQTFGLSPDQVQQWQKLVLAQLFDSEQPNISQWRDQLLTELKDDKLTERRLRSAIRTQQPLENWLALLSNDSKNKDEWLYWQAKSLQKQGKIEQAQQLLQGLLKNPRGFYPLLAAMELKQPFNPIKTAKSQTDTSNNPESTAEPKTADKKSVEISPPKTEGKKAAVSDLYATTLARIHELRILNDIQHMNAEWKTLLDSVETEQKIQLAYYAMEQHWYDLQVEATIQAKAWDEITLRLPNAYSDWFDVLLADKKISKSFAMAIARQESAWRPYVSSAANARGLMQLLPSTAKLTAQKEGLAYDNESQLYDPFNNIMLGTAHLQELYDKFEGNRILMAAAYNTGAARVNQWLVKSNNKLSLAEFVASIPFYETRGYVQNVILYDTYYQLLGGKNAQFFSQAEYNRLY